MNLFYAGAQLLAECVRMQMICLSEIPAPGPLALVGLLASDNLVVILGGPSDIPCAYAALPKAHHDSPARLAGNAVTVTGFPVLLEGQIFRRLPEHAGVGQILVGIHRRAADVHFVVQVGRRRASAGAYHA